MLTTLENILADARAHHYAVPAFDCVEDVMVRAILETAESLQSPVILMGLPPDLTGNGMRYLAGLVRAVADHHPVPVTLHLDHTNDLDWVQRAIDLGFTSVMVDGSNLPFRENVALTRAAVELAQPHGVSVEGELGHVGGMDLEAQDCAASVLTDPAEVRSFVRETEVDALAVSIGTAHGVYRSLPSLVIDRLAELEAASPVPLVLHGGSGTPEPQLRAAINHGICKVNFYADCRIAMAQGLQQTARAMVREDPLPRELFGGIKEGVCRFVAAKIQMLGSASRARSEVTRS